MHQKLANVSALCSADIELCTFLTLSLDTGEWLASHPWHFITMASLWHQLDRGLVGALYLVLTLPK